MVLRSLLALSVHPHGFTVSQLAEHVRQQSAWDPLPYTVRQAAYDLLKLRSKQLVVRLLGTRRYQVSLAAVRQLSAWLLLRDQVLKPVLAAVTRQEPINRATDSTPLESRYCELRTIMHQVLDHLGFAA